MKTIYIENISLTEDKKFTFLSMDASVGTSISVENTSGFIDGSIIYIGQIGQENTELAYVSGTPSGGTITLLSSTSFAHTRGTFIAVIDYDQIEVSWSATLTGAKTVLPTLTPVPIVIQPDQDQTIYRDTDEGSGYYFTRFYNSKLTIYSDYSAAIPYSGYADNQAGAIKQRALDQLGEKIDDLITDQFLNDALNEGRRDLDQDPMVSRWAFRTKFNTMLGQMKSGQWSIAVPTDLRNPNTNQHILALRVGKDNRQLEYQDNNRFRQNYENMPHSTLNGAILIGATSIVLTNSGDFDPESGTYTTGGTIYIGAENVLTKKEVITYTGNNKATNTLTGVTGVLANHADLRDVWQNINFGLPVAYTIEAGYIYFDIPFDDRYSGQQVWIDYYCTMTKITDDATPLDEPEYDMFVSYLKFRIKQKKANGKLSAGADSDYQEWILRKQTLVAKEIMGQTIRFYPG